MRPLDRAVVRVWSARGALVAAPPAGAGLVLVVATGGHPIAWAVVALAVGALVALAGVVPEVRYRHLRWEVEDGVLRIRDGVLWRAESAVPLFRIQHIDLEQGPLDRWAGLQRLIVHTAAPAADVELPGIRAAEAAELRSDLLARSRAAVERHGTGETTDAV